MKQVQKPRPNWFRLLLMIVVAYFIYACAGAQMEWNAIRREANETHAELIQLREQNEKLKQERILLSTPAYVEKLAREELGLVKPGETPYISVDKK